LNNGTNSSSKYLFALFTSLIPSNLISFINLSCKVLFFTSTLHFACGECADINLIHTFAQLFQNSVGVSGSYVALL